MAATEPAYRIRDKGTDFDSLLNVRVDTIRVLKNKGKGEGEGKERVCACCI